MKAYDTPWTWHGNMELVFYFPLFPHWVSPDFARRLGSRAKDLRRSISAGPGGRVNKVRSLVWVWLQGY